MNVVEGFSIRRADEMDELYGQPVAEFCERVRLKTVEHERNAVAMLAMARALDVDFNELCAHVLLRVYVNELKVSPVTAPGLSFMARRLGVPRVDLQAYLAKHRVLHKVHAEARMLNLRFRRNLIRGE